MDKNRIAAMSVKIIKTGISDTLQDEGRYGSMQFGINTGGAMDRYAMRLANLLVGNPVHKVVIEMHFPASAFMFTNAALVALAGADFMASINGEPIPLLQPIRVCKNDVLHFHKPVHGARAYLAVEGGWVAEQWLGSCSSNLFVKRGGYHGRALKKGDEVFVNHTGSKSSTGNQHFSILPWRVNPEFDPHHKPAAGREKEVWVLPGHEWGLLSAQSKENFCMTSFVVTRQADRMGYRLNNIPLHLNTTVEMISSAVTFGTVQLLPDGKPIILMADHQTTGGYPRLAHVISAHRSRLAQLNPGDKIRFRITSPAMAENLLQNQQMHLHQLQNACTFRLEQYFS